MLRNLVFRKVTSSIVQFKIIIKYLCCVYGHDDIGNYNIGQFRKFFKKKKVGGQAWSYSEGKETVRLNKDIILCDYGNKIH